MPSLSEKREALRKKIKSNPPSEADPRGDVHGVLLSDEIAFYANECGLISPFDPANLKPAAYELTVGDEYFLAGEYMTLDSNDRDSSRITIPSFEVAIIKTGEFLRLPRYLIGRWNIRVKYAYLGLLWVGGPQVDPGYVGHLFCPIYNLSDKPVTLYKGEPIAVIDFVKTTAFRSSTDTDGPKRYPIPKRLILEDYGIDELRSALFTTANEKLVQFEEEIKNLGSRFITFTQISFGIFALVIGLVAGLSKIGADNASIGAAFWGPATFAFATAALLIAIFSNIKSRVGRLVYEHYGQIMGNRAKYTLRFLRRAWWLSFAISMLVASGGGTILYFITEPFLTDIRQERVLTKSDLDDLSNSMSANLSRLSGRMDRVEHTRRATIDQLEELKTTLEKEIQTIKADGKVNH